MHRDSQRYVEEQFPIVVCIRPASANVDLLREVVELDLFVSQRGVVGREEVLSQALVIVGVQQTSKRFRIELLDQLADIRVEEILECVRERGVRTRGRSWPSLLVGVLIVVEPDLSRVVHHRWSPFRSSPLLRLSIGQSASRTYLPVAIAHAGAGADKGVDVGVLGYEPLDRDWILDAEARSLDDQAVLVRDTLQEPLVVKHQRRDIPLFPLRDLYAEASVLGDRLHLLGGGDIEDMPAILEEEWGIPDILQQTLLRCVRKVADSVRFDRVVETSYFVVPQYFAGKGLCF